MAHSEPTNISSDSAQYHTVPAIFCYARSVILPPLSGRSHRYHQSPCVKAVKNPPMPVLKGPDTRNLENLFSPRYSNQAVHKAPTLVTSFCQQASMLHLFPPGLEQGPWCPSHHLINWKSLSRWLPRLTRHTVSTPDRTS